MADSAKVETDHSQTEFDPLTYITAIYDKFDQDEKIFAPCRFILESLHEVYKNGEITGERFLDIGTGPVCHTIYSPSKWFKEFVLSDFSEQNLAVLRDWKAGDVKYLKSVFEFMIGLDCDNEDWMTCNRRLADQVTSIVHCDLRKDNPLSGTEVKGVKFDAIGLSLVQIAASLTTPDYTAAVQHYSGLLKPGGLIVVVDVLGQNTYDVGKYAFRTYCAEKESLQQIYKDCGYEIITWKQLDGPFDPSFTQDPAVSLFVMVARKL